MSTVPIQPETTRPEDETAVADLYRRLLGTWNRRSPEEYGSLFEEDAAVVGYDGSQMNGRVEIETTIAAIFKDHMTTAYVAKVREVRFLARDVALLRGVCGMIPPGGASLIPAANAIQSMIAVRREGEWRISLFQNTPAQFHGRPELSEALTEELSQMI